MTDYAKSLKEKLDIVRLPREDFDEIVKDRLDFGFDSIILDMRKPLMSWLHICLVLITLIPSRRVAD